MQNITELIIYLFLGIWIFPGTDKYKKYRRLLHKGFCENSAIFLEWQIIGLNLLVHTAKIPFIYFLLIVV